MSATVALETAPNDAVDPIEHGAEGREQSVTTEDQMQAEIEQKETKEAKEKEAGEGEVQESTITPALSERERELAAERVRQSSNLPPVLKERLAALVRSSGEVEADGKARVPIDEAIRAIEEALPDFLQMDRGRARQPEHPGGDVFFSGEAGELSDAQAEELARGQLARSGLLRGQRARVAAD